MNASKLVGAVLLASFLAPALAQARGPGEVVGEISREVLSAVLGEGISQAFAAAMGIGQGAPNAVTLSDEAFDAIGGIIGNALANQDFNNAKSSAVTALQNAEDYFRVAPGNGMTAGQVLITNLNKINTITQGATAAANQLVNVGLRGLPLYQLVQAANLTAYDEQIAINPVNAASSQVVKNTTVSRVFAHINGQLDHWQTLHRTAAIMPIFTRHSRAADCNIFGGNCQDHWWQYCVNAPTGRICSADFRDDRKGGNSNGRVEDDQAAYNYAFRIRSRELAANLTKTFGDLGAVRRAFAQHAELPNGFDAGTATAYPHTWTTGWRDNELYPRLVGDVDGDGNDDIVSFGSGGYYANLADGAGDFVPAASFTNSSGVFTTTTGWTRHHPRFIADMNGDGKDDIVGFGAAGVVVALSDGQRFGAATGWSSHCGYDSGWRIDQHVRLVGDVNGDNLADIICINDGGVHLSLNRNGRFSELLGVNSVMTRNGQGWSVASHPRMLADVNGDGMADLVGFADGGVRVQLSQGIDFATEVYAFAGFGAAVGGWRVGDHPRVMADVNGDGLDDIVGFSNGGTAVALSNGDGTFDTASVWTSAFGYDAGWRGDVHLRVLADVDGDGDKDLVANGYGNVTTVHISDHR